MIADMAFDGQSLTWSGAGKFKATSGGTGYQYPKYKCYREKGPIPEGLYKVFCADLGVAKDDGSGFCNLSPAWGVQTIPRGRAAGECEPYWELWGRNRARLEPADAKTRIACSPARGGFYLHDSTKGFSHGCIEVDPSFFPVLRGRAPANRRGYFLLAVDYVPERLTNGGTRA